MMGRALRISLLAMAAGAASAESLVATRLIRPGDLLTAEDLVAGAVDYPGTISRMDQAIGFEARVTLFPGRPVAPGDLGPPRLVRRNELVTLIYRTPVIDIRTEGRSLSDGTAGDVVQVMNLESRTRLSGLVSPEGLVVVSSRN